MKLNKVKEILLLIIHLYVIFYQPNLELYETYKKFKENYETINKISDGKNIKRIYNKLEELEII